MQPIEITIQGDVVKALSLNQRVHYMVRHKRNQDYKARAWLAWAAAGRPRAQGKVRLDFIVRRGRSVDSDNAISSMKSILDGLTDQPGRPALLPDDSARWVELGTVVFETGARWRGQEEVVVRVSPAGEDHEGLVG